MSLQCNLRTLETQPRLAIREKNIQIYAKQSYISTACGKENQFSEHVPKSIKLSVRNANAKNKGGDSKKNKACLPSTHTSRTETETLRDAFLYVSEYSSDIIEYLQQREEEKYISQSTLSKYAQSHNIIVNWLIKVQHKLDLPGWTLHAAVSLLDTAICVKGVKIQKLQLVACTALWIAAKCDMKYKVPGISTFCRLSEFSFHKVDMCEMEITLLNLSNFNLHVVSPLTFVSYYLYRLSLKSDKVYFTCNYLLDITYMDINFSTKCASLLAAAAVYAALHIYQKQELWKENENNIGFYTSEKVMNISHIMLNAVKNNGCDTGPFKKYNSSRYNKLSTVLCDWVKSSICKATQ
jgi:hypothetical protein